MTINVRAKGKRAEREARDIFQDIINQVYSEFPDLPVPSIQRNLSQTRGGGYDLEGLDHVAIEVKNHSRDQRMGWLGQTKAQAREGQLPVLAYKITGADTGWRFIAPVTIYLKSRKQVMTFNADMSRASFQEYFSDYLRSKIYEQQANN